MIVNRDAMAPEQRAAWDRLWRILLAPEPKENETRTGDGLATDTDAGKAATTTAATSRNDTMTDRSGTHG